MTATRALSRRLLLLLLECLAVLWLVPLSALPSVDLIVKARAALALMPSRVLLVACLGTAAAAWALASRKCLRASWQSGRH